MEKRKGIMWDWWGWFIEGRYVVINYLGN